MCLAKPLEVLATGPGSVAMVNRDGARQEVSLALVEDVSPGDYVVVQAGYALTRLSPEEAARTLQLFDALALIPVRVPGERAG